MRRLSLTAALPPICVLLLSLEAASCAGDDTPEPVEIRVRNVSDVVMQDVVVSFPDDPGPGGDPVEPADGVLAGDVDYGTVEPGAATPYHRIAKAYSYAPVTLTVDGVQHGLQPDDYVGEEYLEGGLRYTYELAFDGGTLLGIRLVRD